MLRQNVEIPINPSNPSLKLVFDIHTPRPHFIIIQHTQNRRLHATDNDIQEIMQLTSEFLISKPHYDNNTILSFHRGKWYQKNIKYFHAHLYVPKKAYCQDAKLMITSESCNNIWSSSTDYLEQLEEDLIFLKQKYNQYRDRCISMAYLCFDDPVSYYIPLHQFNTSKFTLVFLASTPRIGVLAKKTDINLKYLYFFMNNFYSLAQKKLSLINPLFENFGAHLCLYVSEKKKANSNLTERTDKILINTMNNPIKLTRIVGYIQMDEQLYLRWLPPVFHHIWLKEFKKNQHLVVT
ncbi:unnamed protein product [Adineta steineri]|uniref:Uncharacterized protein n=1 Tax=Adineta steineri TaxID=433720 RepID=A0A814L468_9BILA|nr:unnamed protein product [Adineta steineri]CAF1059210.1 unnamed protein product [Adineta steineri]